MSVAAHVLSFAVGFAGGIAVTAVIWRSGVNRADVARTLLGLLILVMVGYTTYSTFSAAADLRRVTECQQQANDAFARALDARSDAMQRSTAATRRSNEAQRRLLVSVSSPGLPVDQRDVAFAEYLAALDEIDRALDEIDAVRQDNPLVSGTCR